MCLEVTLTPSALAKALVDAARLASASGLVVAVALYGKEAKSFTFQSRWLGEEVAEPKRIKLAELLEEIRENRVPKNTPLLVGSHP